MASIITDEGRNWLRDKLFNDETDETPYIVAVGDGTTSVSGSDVALDKELYRANDDDSTVTVEQTTNTGEFEFRITISGGTEVPAGSDISEFGIISGGTNEFIYREVRSSPITLQSGDRKTIGGQVTFVNT